jgi:acyl carrier protein
METLLVLLERELKVDFPLTADTPLLSSGLIDSLRVAGMLVALESQYGVAIDPRDVGADNFDTAAQIHAFLQGRR